MELGSNILFLSIIFGILSLLSIILRELKEPGKKILFEDLNSYPNDSGMRYVDDVGSNTGDGLMGVGDGLHRYARWENSDQFKR